MTNLTRTLFLVKDLLDELHSEKIELGTGALLRVQELLRQLPEELADQDLLWAMTPLLAHSPQEQVLVYEKFRICQQRADEIFGERPPPTPPPPTVIDEKIRRSKTWFWISAVALALLLGGLAWIYLRPEGKNVVEKSLAVTAGQTTSICPDAVPELDSFGQVLLFSIQSTVSPNSFTDYKTEFKTEWRAMNRQHFGDVVIPAGQLSIYAIQNDTCLAYTARDSVQGMDSLALQVNFSNGNTCELRLRIFVSPPVIIEEKPDTTDLNIPGFQPRLPLPHDHTQAFLDLVVPDADPWKNWLATNWPWLRWLLFGLFSILLFALWRWLEWRRRKLIAELDRPDKPPYIWNIKIDGADDIVLGDAFHHALQVMRRRSATDTQRLDLPRSIQATAEKGGMPHFRFRPQTQPVDYLLLLDRQSAQNHRTQLFDAVFRALHTQELHIERFFYDSDIRSCFNEALPDGVRLADIAQRYGQARLIVVGTGLQLIRAATSRLETWAEETFKNWPARLLLSPKPPEAWGRDERRLSEIFTVLPATLQSLGFWVEELEHGEDARFERWSEHVHDAPGPIYQPNDEQPIPMLQLQFPPEMLRWVAACAIYPSLHWDLTLWLGRKLSNSQSPETPDAGAGSGFTVNLDNLLSLFRIRWFVQGQIPQSARAALLEWLERDSPGLIPWLRRELAELLAQSPPPEESSAWAEHRMAVLLNRWLSETDKKKKKQQEKEIEQLLPQTGADFTVLKYLDRPPSPLHFQVPERWKKYVYRGGFRALGFTASLWTSLGAALLWLLGALSIFSWQPAPPDDGCRGEKVEYVLDGKPLTLCLDSPNDSLLWQERLLLDAAATCNAPLFDSLSKAQKYPRGTMSDSLRKEANANLLTVEYNNGAYYAQRNQRDSACYWFAQIKTTDKNIFLQDDFSGEYERALAWCDSAQVTENKPQVVPTAIACRQVANVNTALAFRSRALTQPEFDQITRNQNPALERSTFIRNLPPGTQVELLDSNALNWQIRYGGLTGYAAKYFRGKPTLVLCSQVTSPLSPGRGAGGEAIPIPEMVLVQGGTFTLGNDADSYEATLSDFQIGATEVTVAQYMAFVNETKTHYPEWLETGSKYNINTGTDDHYKQIGAALQAPSHPIVGISWNDAVAYCNWLSAKTGKKFRLPTEAEWEYAAQGGAAWKDGFSYAGGNNLNELGWYSENSGNATHPVRQKKPNQLGLYDMSGNVWEWCADWYDNYPSEAQTNPKGPENGSHRVIRGGSWLDSAEYCRVSHRNGRTPVSRYDLIGFRLASSPQ